MLEQNLATLRAMDRGLAERIAATPPEAGLQVESAKNGLPTARSADIWLHSNYAPDQEGARWAEGVGAQPGECVTVLGSGLGYHLQALADRGVSGVLIEPDPARFRSALETLDLRGVMERFRLLVGMPEERLRRGAGRYLSGTVALHPASARLNPALARLHSYADTRRAVGQGGLRILVVNPIYGGSLPAARHCATALRGMGHEVEIFASEAFGGGMEFPGSFRYEEHRQDFRKGLASLLSQGVMLKALETQPDMVLSLAQAPLLPETLQRLQAMEIPVAFWFVEDFRLLTYWRDVAPWYSALFGIQKGEFEQELSRVGMERYHYLPTAAAPEVHRPLALTGEEAAGFGSSVSFVGAGYHNRQRFFQGVLDFPFKIWGSDWPLTPPLAPVIQRGGARIDTETCVRIFNATRVNLNLHSSTWQEGVDPDGDFVNPRTFEIAACGAFQLVDRRSLLNELFDEDEMETFSSLEEMRDKIALYLEDEDGRREVAARGRARVLSEHTYQARMEELLAVMSDHFPVLAERRQRRLDERERMMSDLSGQQGLEDLLARIPKGQGYRLQDIYGAIGTGEGKLSRAEKIFLMLQNTPVVTRVQR